MKLREVTPVEHRRSSAFTMRTRGCALEDVRTPVYPVSWHGALLRTMRRERRLTLGDAASKIGVSALELSGLERGRLVPEDSSDWTKMSEALTR